MVAPAPTLASGFFVQESQCWRMVRNGVGHPSHCHEAAGWTGGYVNPKGKRWKVWSCQDHLEGLDDVRPSPSSIEVLC